MTARNHSRSPLTTITAARGCRRSCWRRRLTPPQRQHRAAIAGLRRFLTAALSLPRARYGRRRLSDGFRIIQRFRLADDFGAGSARKVSGLIPCRYRSTQKIPGVSEPHHPFAQGLRKLRPSLGLNRHASAAHDGRLASLLPAPVRPASLRRLHFATSLALVRKSAETARGKSVRPKTRWPRDYVRPEKK